jgi:S-adenosylmethionine/arginine decarboxylase-like enzyme
MFVPNHLHLLVKGYMKTPPKTEEAVNEWLKELVDTVGMKVVAGPTSVYVNEPGNEGVTGTITLATSHAAIHVWDAQQPAMFQFDIYSCKDYEPNIVLEHIDKWFGLEEAYWSFIDRNQNVFYELKHGVWKNK